MNCPKCHKPDPEPIEGVPCWDCMIGTFLVLEEKAATLWQTWRAENPVPVRLPARSRYSLRGNRES